MGELVTSRAHAHYGVTEYGAANPFSTNLGEWAAKDRKLLL